MQQLRNFGRANSWLYHKGSKRRPARSPRQVFKKQSKQTGETTQEAIALKATPAPTTDSLLSYFVITEAWRRSVSDR